MDNVMYLKAVSIHADRFPRSDVYPFNVRILNATPQITFQKPATLFTGANGTGKSALLDAIARKSGLLPWGGGKMHTSHQNPYETQLARYISLQVNSWRPYGFYFRAEAFFNFASSLDDIITDDPGRETYFGGKSLNTLSHGESFLAFFQSYCFHLDGLYLLDEPEAALSPENQVEFVKILQKNMMNGNKQYVIATLSPIILACPDAQILSFDHETISPISYEESAPYRFYQDFFRKPEEFFSL
ncbi:MAG: AAA family ATPase [Desulfomonilaceae bacterium]